MFSFPSARIHRIFVDKSIVGDDSKDSPKADAGFICRDAYDCAVAVVRSSAKEVEESSCLDNVLDSSELEEVEKIEAQIQQETQFDDVSEEDLDLIRVADGWSG